MLNAPRTIPYEFRVVAFDGLVWLYDNSSRTYICDQVPKILLEPLYSLEPDHDDGAMYGVNSDYFCARDIEKLPYVAVPVRNAEDYAADVSERDAWDTARVEANSNCLI